MTPIWWCVTWEPKQGCGCALVLASSAVEAHQIVAAECVEALDHVVSVRPHPEVIGQGVTAAAG